MSWSPDNEYHNGPDRPFVSAAEQAVIDARHAAARLIREQYEALISAEVLAIKAGIKAVDTPSLTPGWSAIKGASNRALVRLACEGRELQLQRRLVAAMEVTLVSVRAGGASDEVVDLAAYDTRCARQHLALLEDNKRLRDYRG
jgi:hypothetical protein